MFFTRRAPAHPFSLYSGDHGGREPAGTDYYDGRVPAFLGLLLFVGRPGGTLPRPARFTRYR
jgi:hypothetical protein